MGTEINNKFFPIQEGTKNHKQQPKAPKFKRGDRVRFKGRLENIGTIVEAHFVGRFRVKWESGPTLDADAVNLVPFEQDIAIAPAPRQASVLRRGHDINGTIPAIDKDRRKRILDMLNEGIYTGPEIAHQVGVSESSVDRIKRTKSVAPKKVGRTLVETPVKPCKHCNVEMSRKRFASGKIEPACQFRQRQFCTPGCAIKNRQHVYPEKQCAQCGIKLVPSKYKGRGAETLKEFDKRKHCGPKCYSQSRMKLDGKPCKHCGCMIYRNAIGTEDIETIGVFKKRSYCSTDCAKSGFSNSHREKRDTAIHALDRRCEYCSSKLIPRKGGAREEQLARFSARRFCNRLCKTKAPRSARAQGAIA